MLDQSGRPILVDAMPVLIGRAAELSALVGQFDVARAGRTTVVALAGEPGIGKSRLLGALAERAAGEGALGLRGSAVDAEGMPPYLPFLEALGRHIRQASADRVRCENLVPARPWATLLRVRTRG